MNPVLHRARDGARFVTITIAITVIYLLLMHVNQRMFDALMGTGFLDSQQRWADEARKVATASLKADRQLPPRRRHETWRLGFLLGFASEWVGSVVAFRPDARMRAHEAVADRLKQAEAIAQALGLASARMLPMRTLDDFNRLPDRIEADETGVAAEIEARLSPRHKHLFLLGMHVGAELCRVVATGGQVIGPDRQKIGRHATLAGIPAELWRPVAEEPSALNPEEAAERYNSAVAALDAYLARGAGLPGDANR